MKTKILHESIIDPPMESENPFVWREGKINPLIRIKIVDILNELKIVFRELTIVGSITGKFWSLENSDIDVTVFISSDEKTLLNYRKVIKVINQRHWFGPFPINFYLRNDTIEDMKTLALSDGIYNLLQDRWEKEPTETDDLEEILKNPRKLAEKIAKKLDGDLDTIAELTQSLLNDYNNPSINFDEKLNLLQLSLDEYVTSLNSIHQKRVQEYAKVLEGSNLEIIRKYHSRIFLPWEIVFKYLTRWLYYHWSQIFTQTLKDDELKKNELKELFQKFVKFWI